MQKLLKELFARHYRDVYAYLYSLSRDAPLSEDLAAEVFLEAVKSIAAFRGECDGKTWLFTIARRRWFAYLRRKNCRMETEMLSEFSAGPERDVEEELQNRMLARRVCELLEREPQRTRNIVLMRIEGFSFYEIGNRYGISESSARVIDFRAKTKIRKILEEEDGGNE